MEGMRAMEREREREREKERDSDIGELQIHSFCSNGLTHCSLLNDYLPVSQFWGTIITTKANVGMMRHISDLGELKTVNKQLALDNSCIWK